MKKINIVIPLEIPEDLNEDDEIELINKLMKEYRGIPDDYETIKDPKIRYTMIEKPDYTRNNKVKIYFMQWEYLGE